MRGNFQRQAEDSDRKTRGTKKAPVTVRPSIKPGNDASEERRFDLFHYRDAPASPSAREKPSVWVYSVYPHKRQM